MVNPIMTQTLPTVVGMGVVSRTTEMMFGKSRRRRGSGKLEGIQIGGKMYRLHTGSRGGKYIMKKGRRVYI